MNLIKEIDDLSCDFCTPLEPQKVMDDIDYPPGKPLRDSRCWHLAA